MVKPLHNSVKVDTTKVQNITPQKQANAMQSWQLHMHTGSGQRPVPDFLSKNLKWKLLVTMIPFFFLAVGNSKCGNDCVDRPHVTLSRFNLML